MDDDFSADLRLLTKAQATALLTPRRITLDHPVRQGKEWVAQPFEFEIDARPLAVLIESAARGHRLYELLRIERPGDVLHYLAVRVTDGGQRWLDRFRHIPDESRRREAARRRHSWPRFDQQQGWSPWRPWNVEGEGETDPWFHWRNSPAALPDLGGLLELARSSAARLRREASGLIAHELDLFDSGAHWRDLWAQPDPVDVEATVPPPLPPERAELVAALIELARRPRHRQPVLQLQRARAVAGPDRGTTAPPRGRRGTAAPVRPRQRPAPCDRPGLRRPYLHSLPGAGGCGLVRRAGLVRFRRRGGRGGGDGGGGSL